MSLRIFHVIFIFAALVMSVFVGAWGVVAYRKTGDVASLLLGIGAFAAGAFLLWYSGWFIRKLKALNLS